MSYIFANSEVEYKDSFTLNSLEIFLKSSRLGWIFGFLNVENYYNLQEIHLMWLIFEKFPQRKWDPKNEYYS